MARESFRVSFRPAFFCVSVFVWVQEIIISGFEKKRAYLTGSIKLIKLDAHE